jgi:uncharacterized protein
VAGRRLPERTCVGCRTRAPKPTLLRVVRAPGSGAAVADPTGSATGRGAYVHRDADCLDLAVRRGALARALRADVAESEIGRLRSTIEGGT